MNTDTSSLSTEQVVETMKAVCSRLGWKVDPPSMEYRHVYLKAHVEAFACAWVSLSYGTYPNVGRMTIRANTAHDSSIYRYGEESLSITVGGGRSAEQIVKEIQRRFLPSFLEIAQKAEAIQKKQDDYRQRIEACLLRLKGEALDEGELRNATFHLHRESIWGSVHYTGDDEVNLEFHSVPMDKAKRVLAILEENAHVA